MKNAYLYIHEQPYEGDLKPQGWYYFIQGTSAKVGGSQPFESAEAVVAELARIIDDYGSLENFAGAERARMRREAGFAEE